MSTAASFDCEATASMLDSWRVPVNAGHAAALAAIFGGVAAVTGPSRGFFAAAVLLWPLLCWFALRVAIDASLFRALSKDPENGARQLDEYLSWHGLAKARDGRSLSDRYRGALRLWRCLIAVTAAQMTFTIAGFLLHLAQS